MRSDSPNRLVEISTGEDRVRELSPHVCVSLLLFTPALGFTEDAGVTSIDAGVTGVASVIIGGAGVAGVAGGTGVPFLGVTLCVFFVYWRCLRLVRTSCALAWLQLFFLLTSFMRRLNDILHALQAFCLSSQ